LTVTLVPAVSDASCTRVVPEGDAPATTTPSITAGHEPVVVGTPPTGASTDAELLPFASTLAVALDACRMAATVAKN
jgi:hypothetical protein